MALFKRWFLVPCWTAMTAGLCLAQPQGGPDPTPPAELKAPPGCRAKPGSSPESYSNTGFAKFVVHKKTGIEMAFIPAGRFLMGVPPEDKGDWIGEKPQRQVTIPRPFYMSRFEVTVEEFSRFAKAARYQTDAEKGNEEKKTQEPVWTAPGYEQMDRLPVECVSWNDSQAFCKWAGLRLPTEAEWEYACRAGTQTAFCFGNDKKEITDWGWCQDQMDKMWTSPHPVGQRKPNNWGLFDVHGNAFEWVLDAWHDNYENAPTDGSVWIAGADDRKHVVRGGSWYHVPERCRSAHRSWYFTQTGVEILGFRPALGIP